LESSANAYERRDELEAEKRGLEPRSVMSKILNEDDSDGPSRAWSIADMKNKARRSLSALGNNISDPTGDAGGEREPAAATILDPQLIYSTIPNEEWTDKQRRAVVEAYARGELR